MSLTLCTSQAILYKAGFNVSGSGAASAAIIQNFADQAEAIIAADTRQDWVLNYANVNANTKGILADACSNLAAMRLIVYDMSGYTSRTEAETMIDFLADQTNKEISTLKDLKTQDFMI